MRIGEIWWKMITNPHRLISDIVDAVSLGRSVLIGFPSKIPWSDDFKEIIESELSSFGGERAFDVHKASKAKEPGEFIFEKYCSPNEKHKYWKTETYEDFMANNQNTVLNTKYVCIEGISNSSIPHWIDSIKRYIGAFNEDDEHGIFILLCNGKPLPTPDCIVSFDYSDYISEYDSLMLCLTIVSELKCSSKEKQYIAEFANIAANGDYEIAGCLAEKGFELIENPYVTLQEVLKAHDISYTSLSKRVDSAIWEAQTKIVFPIVEAYRKYFSERYNRQLVNYLPFKDNMTGQKITTVNELEIGHLFYLSEKNHFANKADHDRLFVIKDARNDVSHWNVIDLKRLRKIIE